MVDQKDVSHVNNYNVDSCVTIRVGKYNYTPPPVPMCVATDRVLGPLEPLPRDSDLPFGIDLSFSVPV